MKIWPWFSHSVCSQWGVGLPHGNLHLEPGWQGALLLYSLWEKKQNLTNSGISEFSINQVDKKNDRNEVDLNSILITLHILEIRLFKAHVEYVEIHHNKVIKKISMNSKDPIPKDHVLWLQYHATLKKKKRQHKKHYMFLDTLLLTRTSRKQIYTSTCITETKIGQFSSQWISGICPYEDMNTTTKFVVVKNWK